jgi:hypothetical protein
MAHTVHFVIDEQEDHAIRRAFDVEPVYEPGQRVGLHGQSYIVDRLGQTGAFDGSYGGSVRIVYLTGQASY